MPSYRRVYGAAYLVDQLLRAFARSRPGVLPTLRPGVSSLILCKDPRLLLANSLPSFFTDWFGAFDGQEIDGLPLHPDREWRALSSAETALRRVDDTAAYPLFVNPMGQLIGWTAEGKRLVYLDGTRKRLPTLEEALLEILDGLGWEAPLYLRPPPADRDLSSLLVELYLTRAQVAAQFREEPARLRPPSPEDFEQMRERFGSVPKALRALYSLGEPVESPGESPHPFKKMHLLSIQGALALYDALMAETSAIAWNATWFPLFRGRDEELFWAYVMRGKDAGKILFVNPGTDSVSLAFPDLEHFAWDACHANRRMLPDPGLAVPESYAASVEQRWILAVGGILATCNQQRHDLLGGYRRVVGAHLAVSLDKWWSVRDAKAACDMAETLLAEHEKRAQADEPPTESLAWDVGRVHFVAGGAYVSMMIDAETAWTYCKRAARLAQKGYDSWKAFGAAYVKQRGGWTDRVLESVDFGDDTLSAEESHRAARVMKTRNDAAEAVEALLAPDGEWTLLPWHTAIGDPPPPIPASRRVRVADDKELGEVLAVAADGDVIALAAGVYRTRVVLDRACLEFEPDHVGDEVVLEAEGDEACVWELAKTYASFRGIHIRARGARANAPSTAVAIDRGILAFSDCTIESAGLGVYVSMPGRVLLHNCLVRAKTLGISLEPNTRAALSSSEISGCGGMGLHSRGGEVVLRECHLDQIGSHALYAQQGSLRAEDTLIHTTGLAAVVVGQGAEVTLDRVQITQSGCSAIQALPDSSVSLSQCNFVNNGLSGLELWGVRRLKAVDTRILHCGTHAVMARNFPGELSFAGCEFDDTGYAVLYLDGEGHVEFESCKMGSSREWSGLWRVKGKTLVTGCRFAGNPKVTAGISAFAMARFKDCQFENASPVAIEVEDHAEVLLENCVFNAIADTAVVVTKASLAVIQTSFMGVGRAVLVGEGSTAALSEIRVENAGQGIIVAKDGVALVDASTLRNTRQNAGGVDGGCLAVVGCHTRDVGGSILGVYRGAILDITGGTLHGGRDFGVEAGEQALVLARDCDIESAGSAIFAMDGSEILARRCRLRTLSELRGIYDISSGAKARFEACDLLGPTDASGVLADGGSVERAREAAPEEATLGWEVEEHHRGCRMACRCLDEFEPEARLRVVTAILHLDPGLREQVLLVPAPDYPVAVATFEKPLRALHVLASRWLAHPRWLKALLVRGRLSLATHQRVLTPSALLGLIATCLPADLGAEGDRMLLDNWVAWPADKGIDVLVFTAPSSNEEFLRFQHQAVREELRNEFGAPKESAEHELVWHFHSLRISLVYDVQEDVTGCVLSVRHLDVPAAPGN